MDVDVNAVQEGKFPHYVDAKVTQGRELFMFEEYLRTHYQLVVAAVLHVGSCYRLRLGVSVFL